MMKRMGIMLLLTAMLITLTSGLGFQTVSAADVIRSTGGTATAAGENAPNEDAAKAFDGNTSTKWLDFHATSWIQYQFSGGGAYAISKYTITSANDYPERDPASWTLKGSNDGANWTSLDTRSGVNFSSRFEKQTFTFSNSTAYKYYKLDNIANHSGSILQLAEVELIDTGSSSSTVTARGENAPNETAAKAFDGDVNTKWLDFSATSWIQYRFGSATAVNQYSITSANDYPERDPASWTLKGSNDGSNWSTLDTRSGVNFSSRHEKKTFTFSNSTSYSYYKLDNTANHSGSIIQIAEISFGTGTGGGGTGAFQVDGSIIRDPSGNEFVVKGVNVNGPRWPYSRETTQDAGLIADTWKFNTVRVNTMPRMEQHGITNNLDLEAIVNAFTAKNVVVIIENHDIYGLWPEENVTYDSSGNRIPSITEMKNWWVDIANKYKNNTYVWFNIANEPGMGGYSNTDSINKWKTFHDTIVSAIRGTGANNIIMLDEHNWGQANGYHNGSSDSAVITHGSHFAQTYDNITFSLHMYGLWANSSSRLSSYVTAARNNGLPVVIGEYGAGDGASALSTESMFNYAVPNKVGRIAWHWSSELGDSYNLTTGSENGGGYEINQTNGSKPTNLTWFGGLVWDDNRGTLSTPVPVNPFGIMSNGNFDDGMNSWSNWGGASVSNSNLVIASGNSGGAGQQIQLRPNTTYKLSAWGTQSAATSDSTVIGVKYLMNGSYVQKELYFNASSWSGQETTFTTPADFSDIWVFVWKNNSSISFSGDSIQITQQ